jgi:hypothetical protein
MTNSMNLEKFGVSSLDEKQAEEIVGGSFINWLKVIGAAVSLVVALIGAI